MSLARDLALSKDILEMIAIASSSTIWLQPGNHLLDSLVLFDAVAIGREPLSYLELVASSRRDL